MKVPFVFTVSLIGALLAQPILASGSVEQKTRVELAGAAGKMYELASTKTGKDSVVQETWVHGDRQKTVTGDLVRIIDLAEEQVYEVNAKKKTYIVWTFDEFKQRLAALAPMAMAVPKPEKTSAPAETIPQYKVKVEVVPTERKETIHGYDCEEVKVVLTAHQAGKTLEQGGGAVITTELMMGPKIDVVKEIQAFEQRYAEKMGILGGKVKELGRLLQASPAIAQAMGEFEKNRDELDGTAIRTRMTIESVPDPNRPVADMDNTSNSRTRVGAKLRKKRNEKAAASRDAWSEGRQVVFTSTSEIVTARNEATGDDLAIPEGFTRMER